MTDSRHPRFDNQRALIHVHNSRYAHAARLYGTPDICPDCYRPPQHCAHFRLYWQTGRR